MAQFTAYRNPNPASRGRLPLLLDVQSPLLDDLATCVVVPLAPVARRKPVAIMRLMPTVEIDGARYIMMTPQLAGIPRKALGPPVADVATQRGSIIAALLTGV
jgi:toxin CcdB